MFNELFFDNLIIMIIIKNNIHKKFINKTECLQDAFFQDVEVKMFTLIYLRSPCIFNVYSNFCKIVIVYLKGYRLTLIPKI